MASALGFMKEGQKVFRNESSDGKTIKKSEAFLFWLPEAEGVGTLYLAPNSTARAIEGLPALPLDLLSDMFLGPQTPEMKLAVTLQQAQPACCFSLVTETGTNWHLECSTPQDAQKWCE